MTTFDQVAKKKGIEKNNMNCFSSAAGLTDILMIDSKMITGGLHQLTLISNGYNW